MTLLVLRHPIFCDSEANTESRKKASIIQIQYIKPREKSLSNVGSVTSNCPNDMFSLRINKRLVFACNPTDTSEITAFIHIFYASITKLNQVRIQKLNYKIKSNK